MTIESGGDSSGWSSPSPLDSDTLLALLSTSRDQSFDRLTDLAARVLKAPIAVISLIDRDHEIIKSGRGLPLETAGTSRPLSEALCRYTLTMTGPHAMDETTARALRQTGVAAYAGAPLRTEDGQTLGALCVMDTVPRHWTDDEIDILGALGTVLLTQITLHLAVLGAQRRTSENLESLNHERDDFFSAAAHDLKGPLTSIQGFAQLFRRRLTRGQEVDLETALAWLDRIDATASRMSRMISELLDITRVQRGRPLTLHRQTGNLADIVRLAVTEAEGDHDGKVQVTITSDHLDGEWDAARMERAISNVLSNAFKYSAESPNIALRAEREDTPDGPVGIITVADQGIGIPPKDLPHIFDRFYRGSNVTPETPGSGIGLTSTRQIIEQHGGTVAVSSTPGGSQVTIRLPLTP